jgi:hypothetical protein
MIILLFGKPIVFWLGFVALASFLFQLYLGYKLWRGHRNLLRLHLINAIVLSCIVGVHLVFGLLLYY